MRFRPHRLRGGTRSFGVASRHSEMGIGRPSTFPRTASSAATPPQERANTRFNRTRCARRLTCTLGPCPRASISRTSIGGAMRRSRPFPGRPSVLAAFQLSRAVRGAAFAAHPCSARAASTTEETNVLLRLASWANTSSATVAQACVLWRRSAAPRSQEPQFQSPLPHTLPSGNSGFRHSIALQPLAAYW